VASEEPLPLLLSTSCSVLARRIYENDLLKLLYHLIEPTKLACSPEGLEKQQKSNDGHLVEISQGS
jgi:hypothetical protein